MGGNRLSRPLRHTTCPAAQWSTSYDTQATGYLPAAYLPAACYGSKKPTLYKAHTHNSITTYTDISTITRKFRQERKKEGRQVTARRCSPPTHVQVSTRRDTRGAGKPRGNSQGDSCMRRTLQPRTAHTGPYIAHFCSHKGIPREPWGCPPFDLFVLLFNVL